jgi:hypothetical protein
MECARTTSLFDCRIGGGDAHRRHGEAEHFAIERLMANSNFTVCWIGKSVCFAARITRAISV